MHLIACQFERHGEAIRDIFNDAIAHTTALYEYDPRTLEVIVQWFELKARLGFPVIGIEHESGRLMAFASFGTFRPFPANQYTIEHSLYVHQDFRGRGLGRLLLQHLIDLAKCDGYHVMIGGIDSDNVASIALHEQFGFSHAGTLHEVAYKFDRWLNLSFYQLNLSKDPAV